MYKKGKLNVVYVDQNYIVPFFRYLKVSYKITKIKNIHSVGKMLIKTDAYIK